MRLQRKRIRELADDIENGRYQDYGVKGFKMEYSIRRWGCGTVACIAGITAIKHDKKNVTEVEDLHGGAPVLIWRGRRSAGCDAGDEVFEVAAQKLGLERKDANTLFFARDSGGDQYNLAEITPEKAAQVLRNLAKTGKVDWESVMGGRAND